MPIQAPYCFIEKGETVMENGIDRELQQEFEQKIGYSFENVKLLEH